MLIYIQNGSEYWKQYEHLHNLLLHGMNEISGLQQTEYFGKENSKECALNHDEP